LSSWQHDSLGFPDASPDEVHPTRTSTRPPHPPHLAPCPYRTRANASSHRRFWLLKIHHHIPTYRYLFQSILPQTQVEEKVYHEVSMCKKALAKFGHKMRASCRNCFVGYETDIIVACFQPLRIVISLLSAICFLLSLNILKKRRWLSAPSLISFISQ
jgi:hypothetical protein